MSQQINLFNPIFLKQKKYFSAVAMAQSLGLILLGSLLMVAYANYHLTNRTAMAVSTADDLTRTKARLKTVTAQYAPREKSKALEDDIHATEADIHSVQQVFDILKQGDFGNTRGYSRYFQAFSRQIIDGVWLTGIDISGAGSDISLDGRALHADLVPTYLARLKREPDVRGASFAVLEMQVPQVDRVEAKQAASDTATAPVSLPTPQSSQVPAGYVNFHLASSVAKDQGESPGVKNK